jgi:hypothetical protein
VTGRVPDVFYVWASNLSVGVKKVGHIGRLPDMNRLSWRDKFCFTFELIIGHK